MTINSTNNEIEYTGNEETTIFVFPYKFFSATDLKVKLDGVLQTGGYGVTGMCDNNGGEVMFDVAPGIGVVINIKREVPATSEFHPTDFNKLPAESLENALDRAVVLAGQNIGISPDFSNSLKVPDEAGFVFNTVLPVKALRVNKYVMFDEDGNVVVGTGGSGGGDVSSSISSTTDGKVAIFDGITGKIIKDTTITGILKASSGFLAQAISDTDFVSVSAFNTLDGRVGTAETGIGTLETDMTSKAGVDLDNISSAGVAVIQSYATGGANVSLSNLDATGNAKFTNKSNVDLDNISSAGVAVIQSYATGGANVSLSNLDATGEARFTNKSNVDLDNISSAGNTVIQTQAKLACQPLPVSTSGALGELKFIYGSASGALSVPAGGTWAIFCKYGWNNSTGAVILANAQFNLGNPCVVAGGTQIANAYTGYTAGAIIMKIA